MLKRLSSKAVASEEARRTLRYVELLSDARTPLVDFFSILLGSLLGVLACRSGILLRQGLPNVFVGGAWE